MDQNPSARRIPPLAQAPNTGPKAPWRATAREKTNMGPVYIPERAHDHVGASPSRRDQEAAASRTECDEWKPELHQENVELIQKQRARIEALMSSMDAHLTRPGTGATTRVSARGSVTRPGNPLSSSLDSFNSATLSMARAGSRGERARPWLASGSETDISGSVSHPNSYQQPPGQSPLPAAAAAALSGSETGISGSVRHPNSYHQPSSQSPLPAAAAALSFDTHDFDEIRIDGGMLIDADDDKPCEWDGRACNVNGGDDWPHATTHREGATRVTGFRGSVPIGEGMDRSDDLHSSHTIRDLQSHQTIVTGRPSSRDGRPQSRDDRLASGDGKSPTGDGRPSSRDSTADSRLTHRRVLRTQGSCASQLASSDGTSHGEMLVDMEYHRVDRELGMHNPAANADSTLATRAETNSTGRRIENSTNGVVHGHEHGRRADGSPTSSAAADGGGAPRWEDAVLGRDLAGTNSTGKRIENNTNGNNTNGNVAQTNWNMRDDRADDGASCMAGYDTEHGAICTGRDGKVYPQDNVSRREGLGVDEQAAMTASVYDTERLNPQRPSSASSVLSMRSDELAAMANHGEDYALFNARWTWRERVHWKVKSPHSAFFRFKKNYRSLHRL